VGDINGLAIEDAREECVAHVVKGGVFKPLWGDCFCAGHEDADLWVLLLCHVGSWLL